MNDSKTEKRKGERHALRQGSPHFISFGDLFPFNADEEAIYHSLPDTISAILFLFAAFFMVLPRPDVTVSTGYRNALGMAVCLFPVCDDVGFRVAVLE